MNDKAVHILVKKCHKYPMHIVYALFGSIGKMKSSFVKGKINENLCLIFTMVKLYWIMIIISYSNLI